MEVEKNSATIEDKNLIESMVFLKQKNLLKEHISKTKFESTKEVEDSAKEEVVSIINEQLNSLKQNISELQKSGYNLKLDSIKLIEVPLKIKIWLSTNGKKDLELILNIIQSVNTRIEPLKKEKEEKEKLE